MRGALERSRASVISECILNSNRAYAGIIENPSTTGSARPRLSHHVDHLAAPLLWLVSLYHITWALLSSNPVIRFPSTRVRPKSQPVAWLASDMHQGAILMVR